METFFRPRQLGSHTSLVSQFMQSPYQQKNLHQALHEQAEQVDRNKEIRELVASKKQRRHIPKPPNCLLNSVRQRKRENWEIYFAENFQPAPRINEGSKQQSQLYYFKKFQGERTHCVHLQGKPTVYFHHERPLQSLDLAGLERRYDLNMRDSKTYDTRRTCAPGHSTCQKAVRWSQSLISLNTTKSEMRTVKLN